MRPWALLPLLEQHRNLGCHPEFGQAGTIRHAARVLSASRESFRFTIEFDPHSDDEKAKTDSVILPLQTLQKKGLSSDSIFRLIGSRAFVRENHNSDARSVFFLFEPQEVVQLLRDNLDYLVRRNDAHSQMLHRRLVAIQEESQWADEALCLELNHLREESVDHIRQILQRAPNRRKVLEAMDRGEALSFLEAKGDAATAVSDLSDHDIGFLVNIVRARYVLDVLQRRTANKGARLTSLGEKLFGGTPATQFDSREVHQIIELAAQAFAKPLSPLTSLAHASDSLVR